MKSSKKLLSLFLAVVMAFSATVMASAYTVGPEVAGDINVKYTVDKIDTVPAKGDSVEYTADNLYAVSIWMQSDNAVENFTAPIHYNKTLFAPIMICEPGVAYPGVDQDTNYGDCGDPAFYVYEEGDYLKNTEMYNASGATVTSKRSAACIGLGNSNSEGVTITAELVSPDHPTYSKWGAGLPENTGVVYVNLDVVGKSKTAYLNTIEGIEASTAWNKMFTFYFEALADDVTGAEFGVYTDDCFTVDGVCDTNAGYFVSATERKALNANKNVVENAKIAAAEDKIVYHVQNQYRPNGDAYDIGVKFGFKAEDIAIAFDEIGTSTNVTAVGADIYVGEDKVDGVFESQYVYDIKGDGSEYHYRVIIEGLAKADATEYTIKPYVVIDGNAVYGEEVTVSAAAIVPQA